MQDAVEESANEMKENQEEDEAMNDSQDSAGESDVTNLEKEIKKRRE